MEQLAIPLWLDTFAVGFGAMAGALAARRHGFDIVGVLFLGVVGGLGGALLRDLLLGVPLRALTSAWLLPATLVGGLLVSPLLAAIGRGRRARERAFVLLDAVSMAMYSLLGTDRAAAQDLPFVSCVFVGVMAGVGGALIRDILVNEKPEHFQPGSFYVLASIPGCIAYLLLQPLLPTLAAALVAGGLSFGLRVGSWWLGWTSWEAGSRRPD